MAKEKGLQPPHDGEKLGVSSATGSRSRATPAWAWWKDVKESKRSRLRPRAASSTARSWPSNSIDEAQGVFATYRGRLKDSGYLWLITRKRGHENYLNQMLLVPFGK